MVKNFFPPIEGRKVFLWVMLAPPFNQARGGLAPIAPPLSCAPALFARSLTFLHWTISNVYQPPYSYFLSTQRILDTHREKLIYLKHKYLILSY